MAIVKIKSGYIEPRGRSGNYIFYRIKDRLYIRSYSMPRNPKTEAQMKNRASFAEAVKLWQKLPAVEKSGYNRNASGKPYTGYNLFISTYMKGDYIAGLTYAQDRIESVYPPSRIPGNSVDAQIHPTALVYLHHNMEKINSPPGIMGFAA